MKKKEFKAESKRLLDLMINSIYTNKEIFLREVISNSSDAIDKLYYRSLTDKKMKLDKDELSINIEIDKEKRTLKIIDNGCGMTKEELENNLGTIAKSGSFEFKENNAKKKDVDIIGQFGVGFYSVFMVSKKVQVISRSYDKEEAYMWTSSGIDGYTIEPNEKKSFGTEIILTLKDDTDEENYSKYLEKDYIQELIKKYSDYITYPIKMLNDENKLETINSLIPIWKKNKNKIKDEEYNSFYKDKFLDYEDPLTHIHTSVEGQVTYDALLFIPKHAPFDYYTKEYKKGLQLYSNGVLIMDKCEDLLPDYYSFIKGVVDSPDLSLNISRETLQQNHVLKIIANNLANKIKKELEKIQEERKEDYETFFKAFGMGLKYGIYNNFGMNKDELQDLLIFPSSKDKKYTTLKEYVKNMKDDQQNIFYACGETIDKIDLLPQVESVKDKGYEILYLTDYVDEFTIKSINKYQDKEFKNVSNEALELTSKEDKEKLQELNKENKDMLDIMQEALQDIKEVRFTNKLKNHPVCLTTEGEISVEMEKVINAMPTDEKINATKILEINQDHKIKEKLQKLYKEDKEKLKDYAKMLYSLARLIEGLSIENPTEISNIICNIISD